MKKLKILSLLVLIPLIVGFVLLVVGETEEVMHLGMMILYIGIPVTMFALVVVGIVLMITGKLSDDKKNDEDTNVDVANVSNMEFGDEREKEHEAIADINSSYGYESNAKKNEYMIKHVANNYKNASPKEKILGWLFFGFLMTDFALIFVFMFLENITGIIVCMSIFAGTIVISLIVTVIKQKASMRTTYDRSKHGDLLEGEVKSCTVSSTTSVGGSSRRSTTRITNVVYRVDIALQGDTFTAYSKSFYETGEKVTFFIRGKHSATIVDNPPTSLDF